MRRKNVTESIADTPSMNHRIEQVLKGIAPAEQTKTLDALEAVKNAGAAGISPAAWANAVKSLYPDEDFSMSDLLKSTVRNFGFVIKRIGDKLYAWSEEDSTDGDYDPETVAAVKSQIDLGKMAIQTMKDLGEFDKNDLGKAIASKTGMPIDAATEYADHVMNQFIGGMLEKIGAGRYRVKVDEPKSAEDHVEDLRKMLRNAGLGSED